MKSLAWYIASMVVFGISSCARIATDELLSAELYSGAGKYFIVTADSIAYANQGFRLNVTAIFTSGGKTVSNYTGAITFSVAGAGSVSSAVAGGWVNGTQTFTITYQNTALAPGASTQIAIRASAAGNAAISGTSNNITMGGPLNVIETVFQEGFESGLSGWNQQAGTWTTATPGANGLALYAPVGAGNNTYTIATASTIDLSAKTNCIIEYEVRFDLSNQYGTYAAVYFGGNQIGGFKSIIPVSTTSSVTSGSVFVPRKYYLGGNISGKISIVTNRSASGAVDFRIDNIKITCNNAAPVAQTLFSDSFESGLGNWTVAPQWANTAGQGNAGSLAPYANLASSFNGTSTITKTANISLVGRYGCQLKVFQKITNTGSVSNFGGVIWNTDELANYNSTVSGSLTFMLSVYEGLSTNQLQFYCYEDPGSGTGGIQCAYDDVEVSCQQ